MCLLVLGLTGCQTMQAEKKSTVTPRMHVPVVSESTAPATVASDALVQQQLKTCLFEAQQLSKLGQGKYINQVNELYVSIQNAKFYASVANNLSGSITDTITPYYQFKVNYACNTISHLLMEELQKGFQLQAGSGLESELTQ